MNEAQKNAIREADNYLRAAGLTTYSEMQTTPRGVTIITSRAIDKIVYEHTKLNPNQADDQDLLAGIRKAILALTTSQPAQAGEVDERVAFEAAMKDSWQMVDPLRPPPAGSYYAGEQVGICAALKTVRANFDRHWQARASLPTQPAAQAERNTHGTI